MLFLTSVSLMGEQRESHTPDSPDEDISVVPLATCPSAISRPAWFPPWFSARPRTA
ncbi:MAG: hypothetical protein V8Q84_00365 [Bilophila sp.]